MAKVFLGDVVDHIKDKVNKDETDLEFYVGGEHIEGREIVVRQKGLIQGSTIGPAFHMRFQKGDVLLMSRNPHLCKASMVDFDGICSDVSYVCRTKDNNILVQSLLPFIMQTDEFWQFAEENKKGGLPFFLNWKDFARFEFELIPIDQQRKISDLLWAFERAKNAYKDLIKKTDDLVKYANYPHIGIDSIEKDTGILSGYRTVKEDHVKSGKYPFGPQHILYSKIRPALNKVALPDFEGLCSADCYPILADESICRRKFLAHVMRSNYFVRYVLAFSARSQMPKVNRQQLFGFCFPCPPIDLQDQFVAIMEQSDKSKFIVSNRNLSNCSGIRLRTIKNGPLIDLEISQHHVSVKCLTRRNRPAYILNIIWQM